MINTTEKSYSIAHTKNHLPVLVHSLESNPSIPITRRGKIVAYLVSTKEYEALKGKRRKFTDSWKLYQSLNTVQLHLFGMQKKELISLLWARLLPLWMDKLHLSRTLRT